MTSTQPGDALPGRRDRAGRLFSLVAACWAGLGVVACVSAFWLSALPEVFKPWRGQIDGRAGSGWFWIAAPVLLLALALLVVVSVVVAAGAVRELFRRPSAALAVSAAAFAAVEAVFWSAVARAAEGLGFGASTDWPALAMGAAFVAVGGLMVTAGRGSSQHPAGEKNSGWMTSGRSPGRAP